MLRPVGPLQGAWPMPSSHAVKTVQRVSAGSLGNSNGHERGLAIHRAVSPHRMETPRRAGHASVDSAFEVPAPRRCVPTQIIGEGDRDGSFRPTSYQKQDDVAYLLKQQEIALRELVGDLEARLTDQIDDARWTALQALLRPMTELTKAFRTESADMRSRIEARLGFETSAPEAREDHEDLKQKKDAAQPISRVDANMLCDLPHDLLKRLSNQVMEQVNSDPRFCKVVESHQALEESFHTLVGIMDQISPMRAQTENDGQLFNTMHDIHKYCKSVELQVRQLRQQRNQDVSEMITRIGALESKQNVLEDKIWGSANGSESKCVLGETQHVQLSADDIEEETDGQWR